YR
ncbi:transketolase, thiamine diphosphate binding domain protein, partial [Vibrio cholerae O1 str. Nep-21106]